MCSRFPPQALFLALLAVACQLALGATVPRPAWGGAAQPLAHFGIICHTDGASDGPATPPDHGPICQFCPLCGAFSAPTPTLLSGSSIPTRATARMVRATPLRPAVAAPATSLLSARPRGP